MSKFTVTVLDTTGIQGYIYSSNRLRENIGASHLVAQATGDWVRDILDRKLGVPKSRQEEPIKISGLNAEVIYAGGGNALLMFKSLKIATTFTELLSKKVLKEAPGINLVVVHKEDFHWDSKPCLYEVVRDLMQNEMERKKFERVTSAPLLGLGVTATCNSTQFPAVDRSDRYINYGDEIEEDSYLISIETRQKLRAVPKANQKLKEMFVEAFEPGTYQFPYRTDHLGRSAGESSYMAIVHADGNGMGKRFQAHGEKASKDNPDKPNEAYVEAMRSLSKSVDLAGKQALIEVTKTLANSIIEVEEEGNIAKKVKGKFEIKDNYLPFRPLVYGGDDTTFVCDGRLGLELAALYLEKLEQQPIADGKPLKACAGISIVKTHYPFARAYELSESLCKEAKQFVKSKKEVEPDGFSALDWHIAASGLLGSISEIRQREYYLNVDTKVWHLEMRPVRLHKHSSEWRTWHSFTEVVKQFNEGEWKDKRNKTKALREVLRQGSIEAVQDFRQNYNKSKLLPAFPEFSGQSGDLAEKGWLNLYCGYFDPIEAMEFYISLEEQTNGKISSEN